VKEALEVNENVSQFFNNVNGGGVGGSVTSRNEAKKKGFRIRNKQPQFNTIA
jgi:hypothetical protein